MVQKWYQKATVQAAIAGGVFVLLSALITGILSIRTNEPNSKETLKAFLATLSAEERSNFDALQNDVSVGKKLEDSDVQTYYRLANIHFVKKEYEKAIELYDKAIQLHPAWYKPHQLKAESFEALEKWEEAIEAYHNLDKLRATNQGSRDIAAVWLNLAVTAYTYGDYRKTAMLCERIVALLPLGHYPEVDLYTSRLAAKAYRKLAETNNEMKHLRIILRFLPPESSESISARRRLNEISGGTSTSK